MVGPPEGIDSAWLQKPKGLLSKGVYDVPQLVSS